MAIEPNAAVRIDPITLQVITNGLYSIADEMMAVLIRASFSTNIKDRRDCSGALFTRDGRLIAQGEIGTPLHVGVMLPTMRTALDVFPPATIEPGDDIMVNTPYPAGPGHLNDVMVISPVFFHDELVAYVGNMAHHVDVGGFAPGSMPYGVWEHYQEGLQIPPVKISRRDKLEDDLLRLIMQNLRTPAEFKGDLAAQIAANNVGERRFQALLNKYGSEELLFYVDELMNYSERRIVAAIQELPKGSHSFSDVLEGDGLTADPIKISVTLHVKGSEIVADFSDTDPQTSGPVNCRPPTVQACVYYVVKAVLDPGLPPNSGAFRPLTIVTRPGTLVHAEYPAALCNSNIVTTQRLVDVLLGAFAQIAPTRVSAACSGTQNLLNIGGRDPRTNLLYNYIETYGGGQGALFDRDGASAVHNHMTNTRNAPVEVIESTYPLFIHQYGMVPESAGAGRFRGGFGIVRELEILSEKTTVTVSSDRFSTAPWGLFGGGDAKSGGAALIHPDESRKDLAPKVTLRVQKGDHVVSMTPGGGGWGPAYERSPEAVQCDVVDELISKETARDVYGVVLTNDLSVDLEATRLVRGRSARSNDQNEDHIK
jgi:N-methylhydantoinase B